MRMRRRLSAIAVLVVVCAFAAGTIAGCSGAADGESLVKSKCTRCHTLDRIDSSPNVTQDEWAQTVAVMEANGLQVTAEERTAIIDYLVQQSAAK